MGPDPGRLEAGASFASAGFDGRERASGDNGAALLGCGGPSRPEPEGADPTAVPFPSEMEKFLRGCFDGDILLKEGAMSL